MNGTDRDTRSDPVWDSREIRMQLTPIARRLRLLLNDLERVLDEDDYDDNGRHGD